jgi:hypothetical protein
MSVVRGKIKQTMKGNKMGYVLEQTSYVSEDGNFGTGHLLTFSYDALSEEQWDVVDTLNDSSKIDYVKAILDGQADLSEWEN